MVEVKLVNRDNSLYRIIEIANFYVRPDAVVYDGEVFITTAPDEQRKDLVYRRVASFWVTSKTKPV